MTQMLQLKPPYLIFLGDVPTQAHAKTALGVVQWAPEKCLAQLRFPECEIDTGLVDMGVVEAAAAGAKSLLIGAAPIGGELQDNWMPSLLQAIESGMDIISGLHSRLNENPQLVEAASANKVKLIDIRVPPNDLPIGNGSKRRGKRLLTVGTDCSVGKKYAAMAITRTLKEQGVDCDFRATGQTGIMIAGHGIPIDSVVADFIAGAAETLSPDNADNHWDIVEGQGSLFQPAYAGVSLGLLHGSQPDAIVVCHDPARSETIGCEGYQPPAVMRCIETNLSLARLTNPNVQCIGVCLNTSSMVAGQREGLLQGITAQTGLPCVDPLIDGVEKIVQKIL